MTYLAQTRSPLKFAQWFTAGTGFDAAAAAMTLNDTMQRLGMRYSELHAHRADLAAGYVLTAEDGTVLRVIPEPAPSREDHQTHTPADAAAFERWRGQDENF